MFKQASLVGTDFFDIFLVRQITRGTRLEAVAGVDYVMVPHNSVSETHRHNRSETILYITDGRGCVIIGEKRFFVEAGMRLRIPGRVYHRVETTEDFLTFISVQSPPIYNKKTRKLDLEPQKKP